MLSSTLPTQDGRHASVIALEDELRALRANLLNAHEQERIRLARELHDDVAQRVSAVAMELTMLARELSKLPADVNDRIAKLSTDMATLGNDIHRLSHQLHPAVLAQLGP